MKIEKFYFEINNKKVEVEHDYTFYKSLNEQASNTFDELKKEIKKDLDEGSTGNFYPYNNFECSITWKII